jgi:hypothetical protein
MPSSPRMFFPHSPVADTMYACIGALIFSLYLVFDTYMILNKLSPDQYIMAALNLYLDIINLFLYILEVFIFFSQHCSPLLASTSNSDFSTDHRKERVMDF